MTEKRRTFLKAIGASGVAIALAGCANDDDDEDDEAPEEEGEIDEEQEEEEDVEEGEEGTIRVAHLSPDAPTVDVSVDDEVVIEDLEYEEFSEYTEVETGSREVSIADAADEDEVVFDEELEIGEGSFTAVALGELAEENHPFAVGVLEDDTTDPGEEARVRLLHTSPDAPNVEITTAEDGEVLFEDVAFGEFDTTTVPEGEYTLEVRPVEDEDEDDVPEDDETEDDEPEDDEGSDEPEQESLSTNPDHEDDEEADDEEDEDEEADDEDEEDEDVVATFDVEFTAGMIYTAAAAGYLNSEEAPVDAEFDLIVVEDEPEEEPEDEEEVDEDEEDEDEEEVEDEEEMDDDEEEVEDDEEEPEEEEVDDDEEEPEDEETQEAVL